MSENISEHSKANILFQPRDELRVSPFSICLSVGVAFSLLVVSISNVLEEEEEEVAYLRLASSHDHQSSYLLA